MIATRLLHRGIERATARRALGTHWPETLGRTQVFILPTSFGLLAALTAVVMLMVALNYQNSPVFLMTFLFAALLWVAMVLCHRHLRGLAVTGMSAAPGFAGEPVVLRIALHNPGQRSRDGLMCFADGHDSDPLPVLAAGDSAQLELVLPAQARGRHRLQHIGLAVNEPFGVFRAWSRLTPLDYFVYPQPAAQAPPPPGTAQGTHNGSRHAQPEDFVGLVRYRRGDRPGQIAWSVYARTGNLERKQFAGGGHGACWLDFDTAPGGDVEMRLSVLVRWALDAEREGARWGLRLPDHQIAPGSGRAHLERCLRALALFPGPYESDGHEN